MRSRDAHWWWWTRPTSSLPAARASRARCSGGRSLPCCARCPRPTASPALLAVGERLALLRAERSRMLAALARLPRVTRVWPSDANFLLAQFTDATAALERAREARLLVRDARAYPGLPQSLRITVGTAAQNEQLLEAWR